MALYRNIAGAERLGLMALQPAAVNDEIQIDPGYVSNGIQVSDTYNAALLDSLRYKGSLTLDPVTLTPVITPTITPSQPLGPTDTTTTTATPSTPATTDAPATLPPPATEKDYLPLLTLAGLFLIIFKGEPLLKDKRKLAFVGGLGALYYAFARKTQPPVTPNA